MLIHHPLRHCLGEEEERLVDVMVLMKILARVLSGNKIVTTVLKPKRNFFISSGLFFVSSNLGTWPKSVSRICRRIPGCTD
jgi:hypothetical protein